MTTEPGAYAPSGAYGWDGALFSEDAADVPVAGAVEKIGCVLPHVIDAATLTASSEAGDLTVDNLQNSDPTSVWRSTGIASNILITQGDSEEDILDCAMFVMPNFTGAHYVQFIAANTLAGLATPAFDTGLLTPWPLRTRPTMKDFPKTLALVRWTNTSIYKYWKLFHYEGGWPTYTEYSRLMMCQFVQFSRNPAYDATEFGYASADIQTITEQGGTFSSSRLTPRTAVVTFPCKTQTDSAVAKEIHRRLGKAKDLGLFVKPAETGDEFQVNSIHGLFNQDGNYKPNAAISADNKLTWATSFSVRELRS